MPKEYVKLTRNEKVRMNEWWSEVDSAKSTQARTVFEEYELVDIGVLDNDGEPIFARRKMNPIGFVHFPDKD